MAWKRVKHPSEVVEIGDEVDVKILKFDRDKNRVSLGLKQMGEDPWANITRRYPEGQRLFGKITNIADYGAFVEIEDGVEGLVHVSEMDWTNKNVHPSKVVNLGDEVEVVVLDIDEERRRISLGMKQCQNNPWEDFGEKFKKGDQVTGTIKSITDFGIFIGLDGGIDGLVHLSDITWEGEGDDAIRNFKKGDELETVVLAVDPERERISLGLKQMDSDPFGNFIALNEKGSIVKGTVAEVDAKGAVVTLSDDGVEGYIRSSDLARDRVDDARSVLKEGDEIEAKFVGVDRKNRTISLSIKAKDFDDEKSAIAAYNTDAASAGTTSMADLLKEQMDK
jgi:small subunit ribosomal protein S1